MLPTPRGTRTTFLLDRAIGYQASGITMAMFEIGPGRGQSMHRHPGEAWLYVVDGNGHSYLGAEPEGGQTYPWKKGDIIVVDHFLWHQHINDDPERTARVVRIHMFDSLLETMRALCDPLVLFEEPPDHIRDKQAGDPGTRRLAGVDQADLAVSAQSLPRGVTAVHVLPAGHHDGPWDRIVVPPGTRERLLGTALVAMLHGRRLAALPAPPSGLIVLAGPPGTGKTTLAPGLAQAAALAVSRARRDDVPRDRPARPAKRDARGEPAECHQAAA